MADVFLMGTSGNYDDPNRDMWREPIKTALDAVGVTYFDPVVREWNDEAATREAEALENAKVVIMAITPSTSGIGSLAESGWAALSAVTRHQVFILYVAPESNSGEGEVLDKASVRARKLVRRHAEKLACNPPHPLMYCTTLEAVIEIITDAYIAFPK